MEKHLSTAKVITNLLEHRFRIFGFEFGLDPIIGLFVGAGDFITVVIGLYFVWIGLIMGLPKNKIVQMVWNLGVDFVLGSVPVIGDIFDFTYRAHTRNYEILRKHYEEGVLL